MNTGTPQSAASDKPTTEAAPAPPDVEAIMDEIRRAAAQAEGHVEDYAGAGNKRTGEISIGIDDQALIERVMARVRAMPPHPTQQKPAPPPVDLPDPIARQLSFDREREYGVIHRLLGKARRWLFRVTKIQAEFEKMYERINADLMNLERRTGTQAVELQQWIERRLREGAGGSIPSETLSDPLSLSPEKRWGVDGEEISRRAQDYVPFVREAAARAKAAGQHDLLDVGCGEGAVLAACREAGPDVHGLEPDPLRAGRCRQCGLSISETALRDFLLNCPEGEYRCVTAIHVLEFVAEAEIDALIGEFRRILAPGGRLLVEVPRVVDPRPGTVTPQRVKVACRTAGFEGVFTHDLHPANVADRFASVDPSLPGAGQLNALIERLNERLCGPRDTLIVAER
ncbi:MAG: class I SAM-dependent methyltransferase [Phycisphaerales bacterium]|nr:MAG: class I SAM-dependent methyltransferase [Phycisphaerales bacterium]